MSEDRPLFGPDYREYHLTSLKRRNVVENLLPGFIERGYSKTKSYNIAKEYGYGIRQSEFYRRYDLQLGVYERSQRIKYVTREGTVYESILEDTNLDIDGHYMIVAKYTAYDKDTKQYVYGTHAIVTDQLGTRNELESMIYNDIQELYPHIGGDVIDVSLSKGFISI